MAKQGRTNRNALLREQQVRRGQLSTAGCQGDRLKERQIYGTGKQSRSFANATGPEKFLLISDRLCSSLPKVRSIR